MCEELRTGGLLGQKVINIYDISNKVYLLKFTNRDNAGSNTMYNEDEDVDGAEGSDTLNMVENKIILLLESGIRFHRTRFIRDKSDMPSNFNMKLRKLLKNKRIEGIEQVGQDRVVDFRFGTGTNASHLILELHSNGNIVLTDHLYTVKAALRSHQFNEEVSLKVNEPYPLKFTTNAFEGDGVADAEEGVLSDSESSLGGKSIGSQTSQNSYSSTEGESTLPSTTKHTGILKMKPNRFREWVKEQEKARAEFLEGPSNEKGRRKNRGIYLKQLILSRGSGCTNFGPEIVEHCILKAGLSLSAQTDVLLQANDKDIGHLIKALRKGESLLSPIVSKSNGGSVKAPKGYVLSSEDSKEEWTDFTGVLLQQHEGMHTQEYPSLGQAVDEYFSRIESLRLEKEANALEENARKKVEGVRSAREQHIKALAEQQQTLEVSAQLLEYHCDLVDKATLVLNSCLANNMDWQEIEDMVTEETENGNPVASLIVKMDLQRARVTLRLENVFTGGVKGVDGDDENSTNTIDVEVKLALSAHANARELFQNKKNVMIKEGKAADASIHAVEKVERQVAQNLDKQKLKRSISATRRLHWFEKFNWFITSEGYLCIQGKDSIQTEQIIMRLMRREDIYVYSQVKGALPVIVLHKKGTFGSVEGDAKSTNDTTSSNKRSAVSPLAIHEAGQYCVCRSNNWVGKGMVSAWWAWGDQVDKKAIQESAFKDSYGFIRGEKHLLPPTSMEMGFGVVFRLDEASAKDHMNDRKDKFSAMFEEESVLSEAFDRYGIEEDFTGMALQDVKDNENSDHHSSDGEEVFPPAPPSKLQERNSENEEKVDYTGIVDIDSEGDDAGPDSTPLLHRTDTGTSQSSTMSAGGTRKKKLSKKKARRYADQDDEDRELAMQALGHGAKIKDHVESLKKANEEEERAKKSEKAGVTAHLNLMRKEVEKGMTDTVRTEIHRFIKDGLLGADELGIEELKRLTAFKNKDAAKILQSFREAILTKRSRGSNGSVKNGDAIEGGGNKSGLLAGIMRRFDKEGAISNDGGGSGKYHGSGRDGGSTKSNPNDEEENESMFDDGDILDNEYKNLHSLCAHPTSKDVLLYALPFCGPYASMQNFKFRLKLSPGTVKKSKAAKTAIDAFTRTTFCSQQEKELMTAMPDAEMTSVLISDIRLSMPGLQKAKVEAKKAKQSSKRGQRGQKKK
jgi:predicted ribosome quality control (RQC) complex YloA/Tae2 family protein